MLVGAGYCGGDPERVKRLTLAEFRAYGGAATRRMRRERLDRLRDLRASEYDTANWKKYHKALSDGV